MRELDPPSLSPELERQRAAYHEAGHAVVAWKLGIPIVELAIESMPGHGELARGLKIIEETRGSTAMHVAAAVFMLAGHCAQVRWNADAGWRGCEQDRVDAREHATALLVRLRSFEEQAEELVHGDWHRVEALAVKLIERPVMPGTDAIRIIEGAAPQS
jgi:hypothetical protein